MINSSEKSGMAESRPRQKLGLALIVSLFLFAAGISQAATGYHGQRGTARHGHSSNTDGGVITNLAINGRLTPATGILAPAGSTVTIGGYSNIDVMISSADPVGSFVTTITIPSPFNQSSVACHVDLVWFTTSSVSFNFYVNGDRGSKYSNAQQYHSSSGSGYGGTSGVFGRDRAPLIFDGDVVGLTLPLANTALSTRLSFETLPSGFGTRFVSRGEFSTVAGGWYPFSVSVLHNNASAAINTITIITHNSTVATAALNQWPFTGHWELWCKGFSHR